MLKTLENPQFWWDFFENVATPSLCPRSCHLCKKRSERTITSHCLPCLCFMTQNRGRTYQKQPAMLTYNINGFDNDINERIAGVNFQGCWFVTWKTEDNKSGKYGAVRAWQIGFYIVEFLKNVWSSCQLVEIFCILLDFLSFVALSFGYTNF